MDKQYKAQAFTLIGSIGTLVLLTYSLINFAIADYPAAVYEMVSALLVILSLYLLRRNHFEAAIALGTLVIISLAVHNFYSGGFYATGLFWVFVLACTIFLINDRKSFYCVSLLFAATLTIFILKLLNILTLPYSDFTVVTFFLSLGTISSVFFVYVLKMEDVLKRLNKRNRDLEQAFAELNQSSQEIAKKSAEIEKLNKVFVGRELEMIELKKQTSAKIPA